jgi:hypothetical protein
MGTGGAIIFMQQHIPVFVVGIVLFSTNVINITDMKPERGLYRYSSPCILKCVKSQVNVAYLNQLNLQNNFVSISTKNREYIPCISETKCVLFAVKGIYSGGTEKHIVPRHFSLFVNRAAFIK